MEVTKDRLATTDEFGDRVYMYPAEVKGPWRQRRTWTQLILVIFFLVLPWIKIGGDQALLLSIPERRFAFFGLILYAHDGPLIFFVLAIAAFGLFLTTAILGRAWCGWACPQTVFIDGVFRRIEQWIEGNHIERRKLDQSPPSFMKLRKKTLKWVLFFLISTTIAHSFVAYFVGAERLAKMSLQAPSQNWVDFIIVFFFTFLILFDFAWFREQFCIIMCPYGRFQSVLMDKDSLAVMYDEQRGEPRKGSSPMKASSQPQHSSLAQTTEKSKDSTQDKAKNGDCVNCGRCIMVCPTGIDIRRGIQMECINCTACIDACDEIMEKVQKPKGLIKYFSISQTEGKSRRLFSPRRAFYSAIILLCLFGLIFKLSTRMPLRAEVLRVVGAPYRLLTGAEEGMVINQFKMHLQNQSHQPIKVHFEIINPNPEIPLSLIEQAREMVLQPGELTNHFLFLKFRKDLLLGKGRRDIPVRISYEPLSIDKDDNADKASPAPFIDRALVLLGP